MRTALTIAGSDCSGGAGIQADIKTMTANKVYAMSAITALTAQNTTGVSEIINMDTDFVESQLEMIFEDIYPDAVKIGMVSSSGIVESIEYELVKYKAKNIVLDPVMVATSGSKLIEDKTIKILQEKLFPLASVITPNIMEAEVILGISIKNDKDMLEAAKIIYDNYGCAVLLKGGHSINDANDLLYEDKKVTWFFGKHIDNPNTHGTGCTLSSAIAANLAKRYTLEESVKRAKCYISEALLAMLDLGKGSGPMNHAFNINGEYAKESENE